MYQNKSDLDGITAIDHIAVVKTKKGELSGTIKKLNHKTFWFKFGIGGKNKFIKRNFYQLSEIIEL